MDAFDFAAAIAEFALDSQRTSLQLPQMTTGQRKNAKKLLEQYGMPLWEILNFVYTLSPAPPTNDSMTVFRILLHYI